MKNNSKIAQLSRRDFIVTSSTLTAGFVLGNVGNTQAMGVKTSAKRKIGTFEVSALGLGCMNMAGIYKAPMPKADMVAVIRKAYGNGITFLDTADTAEVYVSFLSEEIVGEEEGLKAIPIEGEAMNRQASLVWLASSYRKKAAL